MQNARPRRGRQIAITRFSRHAGPCYHEVAQRITNFIVFGNVSAKREKFHGQILARAIRNQLDGGAHTEGCHTILRICARAAKGSLSEHPLLEAANQSIDYILQFNATRRIAGEKDNRARLLLLLHSRKDGSSAQKSCVP